ncbi:MAG TPA: nitroreductase family protein [Armatimonadota bacterium]|jgi:nitroreductase|nr:nitroreductase family protein [Armatimonadota bacterium]
MDTIQAIRNRRSVRAYVPDPVPDDHLEQILEAGRQAPSARNRQPWHFIVVRDPERREAVAKACAGQMFMADADVTVCVCGLPAESDWQRVDASIALQNMVLAATAFGYGTCWIGAMDKDEVRAVLGIPPELEILCLTPIGVPDADPDARPRKPMSEICSSEQFGTPWESTT